MYKYLGIRMRDDGSLSTDMEHRKQTKMNLKKKLWLIRSSNLGGTAKMQLWQTLFKAKWAYGHQVLSTICVKFKEWIKSCHYEGVKALMGINRNPNKQETLKVIRERNVQSHAHSIPLPLAVTTTQLGWLATG